MRLRPALSVLRPMLVRVAHAFSRTVGAMLGAFIIMNALGDLLIDHFGMDFVWISFPTALAIPGRLVLLIAAAALLRSAIGPIADRRLYIGAQAALIIVAFVSLINAVGFYVVLIGGLIASDLPVPSSFLVTATLGVVMHRIRLEHNSGIRAGGTGDMKWVLVTHAACAISIAVAAPLAFMLLYGATDYCPRTEPGPRAADCIIVYGARVYVGGTPSLSLSDRTDHGVRLWQLGAAPVLVMSGGPNELGYPEPRAMLEIARGASVPDSAIVLDEAGRNTYHTVSNAKALMSSEGWRQSISVSHHFHLLRIKLIARRLGTDTLTVPCVMTRRLLKEPYFVLRECAALYWYYFTKW